MKAEQFKQKLLDELYAPYKTCKDFPLYKEGATNIVLGQGNPNAKLMIIGEAPGREEDLQGIPFVGRSGALLNKTLEYIELKRQEVFITNVVKCRPPNNRTPTPEEIASYSQLLLYAEIKIVRPTVLMLLGSVALQAILKTTGIGKLRGALHDFEGITTIPTYHPAYILRNPAAFTFFKQDFQKAKSVLIR